jgi:hypothetical protein
VTVTVYVFVVVVSPAVTTTLMAEFAPTVMAWADDADPDVVEAPATVTDAAYSVSVGVIVMEATELTTVAVYAVVAPENVGVRAPELRSRALKVASLLIFAKRVTCTVYVFVVVVSCAVATTVTVVADPAVNAMLLDAAPDATITVCTVMEAPECVTEGVTVMLPMLFDTVDT